MPKEKTKEEALFPEFIDEVKKRPYGDFFSDELNCVIFCIFYSQAQQWAENPDVNPLPITSDQLRKFLDVTSQKLYRRIDKFVAMGLLTKSKKGSKAMELRFQREEEYEKIINNYPEIIANKEGWKTKKGKKK